MRVVVLLLSALPALAQTICGPTPTYSPCEIAIELSSAEAAANPNPYVSVQIDAEFRSPRYRTFKLPAYWDGGRRFVVRVAPTDAGQWLFRLSSNLPDIDGKEGQFEATDSKAPGFLKPANVHHWALVDDIVKTPHLWMGDTLPELPFMDRGLFDKIVDARAAEKFTHIRGIVLQRPGSAAEIFTAADKPNPGAFQELDSRVLSMNRKGIVADLTLAYDGAQLTKLFPTPNDRARYARYVAARYAGLQVTWQLVDRFEDSLGSDAFRHALWNATMDGQYPTMTRSKAAPDPDSPAARQMGYWFDLMSASRHWELEPYFDVDGGRAIALEGVEYLVYVEKPGPVEVLVEQHGYDVAWFNTLTGEWTKEKKPGIKNGRYSGKPPDDTHDWVLRISREGHKQSMLRSYKFDSRETPIGMQEIEQNPQKTPFEIAQPATDPISASKPPQYAAKVTRDTRATRQMMWLWTGEVADEHQGFRVLGSGAEGTFHIPQDLATSYPAMLALRLYGMNANGKVYSLIRIYNLAR